MVTFVDVPVRVSVPATSANLGPGFDSLGLALDLRDQLEARITGAALVVEVEGVGADSVPLDESHLVVRSMRVAFESMGEQPPGLHLSCHNVVPHARGLGSSAAAIVGGLSLARALVEGGPLLMDDDELFRLAARIEGHPDNVAPAFYGGFVISGQQDDTFYAVRSPVDAKVGVVAFIPQNPVSTEVARHLLPAVVPHAEAAADAGRAALLVAALAGQPEHLLLATRDYLHQEYRRAAMPESLELVDALRAEAIPAIVSGAGPTVLAFTVDADEAAPHALGDLLAQCPEGWQCWPLAVDRTGVVFD